MLEEALALHRENKIEQAAAAYDKVLRAQPHHAMALHLRGLIHHQQGNIEQAEAMLSEACDIEADNAAFFHSLANLHAQQQRFGKALALYDRAREINPNLADAHAGAGHCLLREQQPQAAEKAFALALRADETHVRARHELGNLALASGDVDRANAELSKAVQIEPRNPLLQFDFARALLAYGASRLAGECVERVLEMHPDFAPAKALKVEVLLRNGEREAARQLVIALQEQHPERAETWQAVGDMARAQGDLGTALRAYRHGLQQRGAGAELALRIATLAEQQHAWEAAAQHWQRLADANPQNQPWRLHQAVCLARKGDVDAALECLSLVNPRSPSQEARLLTTKAEIEQLRGDNDTAAKLAERALQSDDSITSARLIVAADRLRHGDAGAASSRLRHLQQRQQNMSLVQRIRARRLQALAFDADEAYEQAYEVLTAPGWHAGKEQFIDTEAIRARMYMRHFGTELPESDDNTAGENLVFITGAQGSGLQNLLLALGGHEQIELLNDRQGSGARSDFLTRYFDQQAQRIDKEKLPKLRRRYFEAVARLRGDKPKDDTKIVDTLPIELANPALISQVFPAARQVYVQREPADATLQALLSGPLAVAPADYQQLLTAFAAMHDVAQHPGASGVQHWQLDELLNENAATLLSEWLQGIGLDSSTQVSERWAMLRYDEFGLPAYLPRGHATEHYQAFWRQ